MASLDELRAAIRTALYNVLHTRFTRFGEGAWLDYVSEVIAEVVQPRSKYLDQIAALHPEKGKLLIGTGEEWVLWDSSGVLDEHLRAQNPHGQYQTRGERNLPDGYAGLDGKGLIPPEILPFAPGPSTTAHASTSIKGSVPATGNPFAGATVQQLVTPQGIEYAAGIWTVEEEGVYEVAASLVLFAADNMELDAAIVAEDTTHAVPALTVDGDRRVVQLTALLELGAGQGVQIALTPTGAITPSMADGSTVTIRRIA